MRAELVQVKAMKRRGFLAAMFAVIPTAVLAQGLRPRSRRVTFPPYGRVNFPEYRKLGAYHYMRVQRTYWRRPIPITEDYVQPWGPCLRRDFDEARRWKPSRGINAYDLRLQPGYKSPVRIWWESYQRRLARRRR